MINISEQEKSLKNWRFIDLFFGIVRFHYALKSFGAACVLAYVYNDPKNLDRNDN